MAQSHQKATIFNEIIIEKRPLHSHIIGTAELYSLLGTIIQP